MSHTDLSDANIEELSALYTACNTTLDDLPYTSTFEELYETFISRTGLAIDRHGVWRALSNARKAGKLIRKQR